MGENTIDQYGFEGSFRIMSVKELFEEHGDGYDNVEEDDEYAFVVEGELILNIEDILYSSIVNTKNVKYKR